MSEISSESLTKDRVRDESGAFRREALTAVPPLAPAAWPFQPGENAAEINYHGLRPENADGLTAAAARIERR